MAFDPDAVRVAGIDTHIYLAPVGTAFPDSDEDLEAALIWEEVGYVTEDGVTYKFGRDVTDIMAMQSQDPIRVVTTKLPKTIGFQIMQSGREQLALALGGGTWAAETGVTGFYRYSPPDTSTIVERAVIVQMLDGTSEYRWHYKRAENREGVEFKYVRDAAATLPITLAVLAAPDGTVPFYMTSNDPALAS